MSDNLNTALSDAIKIIRTLDAQLRQAKAEIRIREQAVADLEDEYNQLLEITHDLNGDKVLRSIQERMKQRSQQ